MQFLKDILITAVEGGINSWCTCRRYDPDNGVVEVREDDTLEWRLITIDTIAHGVTLITSKRVPIREDLLKDVTSGSRENDAGYIDADGADCVVQIALFNELVYG
jgi:hypothetical protein